MTTEQEHRLRAARVEWNATQRDLAHTDANATDLVIAAAARRFIAADREVLEVMWEIIRSVPLRRSERSLDADLEYWANAARRAITKVFGDSA